jgi:hypothetical protein
MKVARDRPDTIYVSLDSVLCDDQVCWAEKDDKPLYEDKEHLSSSGARFVASVLSERPELQPLFASVRNVSAHVSIEQLGQ